MKKHKASPSPRPGSACSSSSSQSSRSRGPAKGINPHVGPRPDQPICISEEVKIGINLAVERFRLNDSQKDLEFPNSLTATERAYIHRLADDLGFSHKSKGKGQNRYLILTKKSGSGSGTSTSTFHFQRNSWFQINGLLQRFPVSNKERMELMPSTDKSQVNEVSKELARTATGRLNNGLAQVPPRRGDSDLSKFTHSLPINKYSDLILRTINSNQVCLISGETGSGKTTQVPQMILDDCSRNSRPCRIFCTQPRRIAALSISERVASERGEKVGQTVGFQIRLESRVSPKTLLTFCTNGVLLRTLMGNESALSTVTHVIVDEVHERDRFSDFLLISLKEIIKKNSQIKVILMSATLNTDLFRKYFDNCPLVSVPGNLFPVREYFLEDVLKWTGYSSPKMEKYKRDKAKVEARNAMLTEWCSKAVPYKRTRKHRYNDDEESSDDTDRECDDREDLTMQLAQLGVEQESDELEPWVTMEMDGHLSEIWLTGNKDVFSQVFHLFMSENISVDYQHSQTSITALMIAAGRGFPDIVEQLLNMGADPSLKASNDWTAIDWAKKFEREDITSMLEAQLLASELKSTKLEENVEDQSMLDEEDQELLSVYQHCWDDDKVDTVLIIQLLHKIITSQPDGAVLIFLPGYDEIVALRNMIDEDSRFASSRYSLFQLHSSMQSSDQKRVFRASPHGVRKIILATNIAETSITINDVVYVIDAGKVKEKTFDALLQITMLKSNWVSKASASQRKGRAGRVQPGVCYHMFSKVRYHCMQEHATPELLRFPLQELCLQTKLLAPVEDSIAAYLSKAPESPPFVVVRSATNILKKMDALDQSEELTELGRHLADLPVEPHLGKMKMDALDQSEELTELGRHLADLPVEPHLGKMVLNSIVLKCLDPVLTIVCCLAHKDPFQLPGQPSEKRQVKMIKGNFSAMTFSDHMTLLRAFQAWQKARTDGWERAFCAKNYISGAVMEMIVGMRAQLLGQLRASGFVRARGGGDIRDLNTNSENWPVVKAALCGGAYPNIIRVDHNRKKLQGASTEKVMIHTSSVVPAEVIPTLPADWIFYEEMTRTGNLACVRCCTLVSSITVALFAGPAKLPADALKDMTDELGEDNSDSENDDPNDNKQSHLSVLQLADNLTFRVDSEAGRMALQLRQKWHTLFLRRMRCPSKPLSQMDESVINTIVNVLTNEEQVLGIQQPAGIGQRPRPMSAESIMSGGGDNRGHGQRDNYMDNAQHRFSTSAKKATSTPPKRKDFLSPRLPSSNDSSALSSPLQGSGTSSPSNSPGIGSQQGLIQENRGPSRYFVMKCYSQKNVDLSVSKGAWATSKANERKLNKAFQDGQNVFLIFSVQGSGHFQGYAKMSSIIGTDRSADFNGSGGVFSVDWVKRGNLPFTLTHHLRNKYNEHKRVQISRDGQELEPRVGESLCKLWEQYPGDPAPGAVWPYYPDPGYQEFGPGGDAGAYQESQYNSADPEGQGYGYYGNEQYNGDYGYNWNMPGQGHYYGYQNPEQHGYHGYHGSPQSVNSPVMILQRDWNQGQGHAGQGHGGHGGYPHHHK